MTPTPIAAAPPDALPESADATLDELAIVLDHQPVLLALPWELLFLDGEHPVEHGKLDLAREAVVDGAPACRRPAAGSRWSPRWRRRSTAREHGNSITLGKDGIVLKSVKDLRIDAGGNVEINGSKVDIL